jgi:hypothetical protein
MCGSQNDIQAWLPARVLAFLLDIRYLIIGISPSGVL